MIRRWPERTAATLGEAEVQRIKEERPLRYSGNIMMNRSFRAAPLLIPSALTRQLCEIESTTYHEGAVGDFLADFLPGRGWEVEKTPVPQPPESARGPALERLCRACRADAGSGVFHAHGYGAAVYPVQRGCGVHVWARSFRRQGHYRGAGRRCRSAADGGISDWVVVCQRRRARLGRRQGRES